jgi:2-polyprenyl-6-methoxyphenol hydroxylase-like FAD-dependent oxidoreductase
VKPTVEIAGAGIAGLTAGLAFAQKGWRVRVHEQGGAPRMFGEGIYLWENGLRVLDALGVMPPMIDIVCAARHQRRRPDGEGFSIDRLGHGARLYAPLRGDLESALCRALIETGGEVVFNSRAVAADPSGQLSFANGSSCRADLVIAADGIDSTVRDSLGLLKWRRPANQFGYRAVVSREPGELEAEIGCAHREYWNGSRRLLYAPCTARLAYVQLTSLAGDEAGNAVPLDRAFWRDLFPDLARIVDRIPDDGHGEWFEIVRLRYWSSGRVAIVGNAAAAQPPFLGHGVGCAMMSAFALAQTIDAADDLIDGLTEWELRERPFTEWVQRLACRYNQLAYLPVPMRMAAFRAIDASEWLRRRTVLAAAYRDVTAMPRYAPPPAANLLIFPMIH